MPLPTPNTGEEKDDFIERCMSDEVMRREFPATDKRVAVCNDTWRDEKE